MAKKKTLVIPINFLGNVTIPNESIKAVDSSIKRGELSLGFDLISTKDPDVSTSISVYPDGVNGVLKFKRDDESLVVEASGSYVMEIGEWEEENLDLPAFIMFTRITDENADSYYFGDDGIGILTDTKVESFS
jgi:hypothetical protein